MPRVLETPARMVRDAVLLVVLILFLQVHFEF